MLNSLKEAWLITKNRNKKTKNKHKILTKI